MQEDEVQEVLLKDINLDRETQIRVEVSEETVQRYCDAMIDEATRDLFPPILLFRDPDGRLWLADGHHRVMAAIRRKFTSIRAIIRPGMKADAIWEAAKANGRNGLQLGRADIRRTVIMLLKAFPSKSTTSIAEVVGCNQSTVVRIKNQVMQMHNLPEPGATEPQRIIGKDGKSYKKNKKRKPHTAPASAARTKPKMNPISPRATCVNMGNETKVCPHGESQPEKWPEGVPYPPLSQPIPEKYSQFVQSVKLQNIPLNDPERLIACLFDLFSAEYREKLLFDLAAQMEIDDGKRFSITRISEMDNAKRDDH